MLAIVVMFMLINALKYTFRRTPMQYDVAE